MPMGGPLSLWEKPSCKKLRGPMGGTKSKPNAVDSIWNGGARERQNECAMSFAIEMKKLVASDMSLATSWRRRRDSNPRTDFSVYSLSRGAPYSHLGTSAWLQPTSHISIG